MTGASCATSSSARKRSARIGTFSTFLATATPKRMSRRQRETRSDRIFSVGQYCGRAHPSHDDLDEELGCMLRCHRRAHEREQDRFRLLFVPKPQVGIRGALPEALQGPPKAAAIRSEITVRSAMVVAKWVSLS